MLYLLTASFIWAFSFGLIKGHLSNIDPNVVSFLRILISFIIFIPFLKIKKIRDKRLLLHLLVIGAVQFGLMYLTYIYSFRVLKAYEVAVFTIMTPIYVTIINDLIVKRFDYIALISSMVAITGAGVIVYTRIGESEFIDGVLIVQASNICFAIGQIYYKKIMNKYSSTQSSDVFAVMYLGALIVTGIFTLIYSDWRHTHLNTDQFMSVLYLGVIASGLGFYLWNIGVRVTKVSTLSVMNNVKIPIAVLCSILIFSEEADWTRLLIGGGLMLISVIVSEKYSIPKYLA